MVQTWGGRVARDASKWSSSASFKLARASSSVSPWLATSYFQALRHIPVAFAPHGCREWPFHDFILPHKRSGKGSNIFEATNAVTVVSGSESQPLATVFEDNEETGYFYVVDGSRNRLVRRRLEVDAPSQPVPSRSLRFFSETRTLSNGFPEHAGSKSF